MIEFKENKWAHKAMRQELEKKFNKNWENLHTDTIHGEYEVYTYGDELPSDKSYVEFRNYLESSNFDFSEIFAEAVAKEPTEARIKAHGPSPYDDDNKLNINKYPSIGDLNYFASHTLLKIKIDDGYCIFHIKIRPTNLLLERVIEMVDMPADVDCPTEHIYMCESNLKPELMQKTYYVYFTNQELNQNFNDEVLILTDNIEQNIYLFDQTSTKREMYRSFENIDDALETMFQILNTKGLV